MIYGAGLAGRQLAAALKFNENYHVKGFFDDNIEMDRLKIFGYKVFSTKNIKKIIEQNSITDVIIVIKYLSTSGCVK